MFIISEFQELVIRKLEEIASDVKDIKRQNRQILVQANSQAVCDERSYPPLPLKSLAEVEETEKLIRDRSQFQKLVFMKIQFKQYSFQIIIMYN